MDDAKPTNPTALNHIDAPSTPAPKSSPPSFLALAAPMIISRLGLAAMSIADGIMLAQFSTHQFALQSIAEALAGRMFDVAIAFILAGVVLASQARASDQRHHTEIGRIWQQALALALFAGAIGFLIGTLAPNVFRLTGQTPQLSKEAGPVLFILCIGMLPGLVAMACAGILEALGRPIGVAVAVILGNVLNIALNLLLINGGAGIPALGAIGSALSTTIVRFILAFILIAAVWFIKDHKQFGIRRKVERIDWSKGKEQRARGISAAGTVTVLATLSLSTPVMAGWIGTNALALSGALFLALAPFFVMSWGLADAASIRIAALLGQGSSTLRRAAPDFAALSCIIILPLALLYLLFPHPILSLVIPDKALTQQLTLLIPLGVCMALTDGMSFLYGGALRSLGELTKPFIAQTICGVIMWPLSYALAFGIGIAPMGVTGLVLGCFIAAILRVAALAYLYDRASIQRSAKPSPV